MIKDAIQALSVEPVRHRWPVVNGEQCGQSFIPGIAKNRAESALERSYQSEFICIRPQ